MGFLAVGQLLCQAAPQQIAAAVERTEFKAAHLTERRLDLGPGRGLSFFHVLLFIDPIVVDQVQVHQ